MIQYQNRIKYIYNLFVTNTQSHVANLVHSVLNILDEHKKIEIKKNSHIPTKITAIFALYKFSHKLILSIFSRKKKSLTKFSCKTQYTIISPLYTLLGICAKNSGTLIFSYQLKDKISISSL